MPRRHPLQVYALLALATFLSGTGEAHGERGAGIGTDLAVDQALRAIEAQSARKQELTETLVTTTEREHALQATLRAHVRALYRVTRNRMSPVAGGFDAMRLHLSRIRRLKTMVQRDFTAAAVLQREQAAARQAAEQTDLALATARQQLTQLRAEQAITRAQAEPPQPASADHGFYGLRLAGGESLSSFEGMRGKLATPVSGELRLRDGKRGSATTLLFEAASGTSVRAAAAGRVVFADPHSVVLDHGDGYQTVYGQLGNVDVRTGDSVSGRARLGSIADSDQDPALVFELRRGTRSIAPRPWLGL
jgi:septal ring factor EnvC (AmiA/AmiB activator)